ncbi:uncharacterized protein N7498_000906 [Penicillium cinerascens]|uniref:ADF-H domain-containing protein n=1 Tax=Penicillium cinerascens TaxID=70096 RepID=A0A9W9TDH6_9EURO|nr:uncharacterized protein N7498_000906 [Penicillium cinerascens]KAJ5218807.1 hypothetical protein N7498_000906 [Penicillium cinerascens]
MSLNGLDNPAVVEAYQSALADAGGWILLHYTARDEVALLDRGTGGVPEVRNAIENYEETSPLYGFLQYRRRKVILRYMPEGLSRLIQARSNVQFQSVLDKFTPNDTVLALSLASELNESALSSACLLHTASGSITSSSSSLRRRRLMEITEDAEENGTKEETKEQEHPHPPSTQTKQRSGSLKSEATIVPPTVSPEENSSPDLRPPPSRASSRAPSIGSPPSISPSESQTSTMSPKSPDSSSGRFKYRNILDEFPRPSEEARMSTQSARPSLRDLERAAGIQPKVKLGPRPSVDSSGRPRTSGSSRNSDQRPVASLPSGMRSSSLRRSNVEVPRPRSQGSSFASKPISRAPPIPPLLVPPPNIPISRPPLSPGAKSLGALSTSSGLTPEKERLMKALQQRKKQMAKRAEETKKKQSIEEEPKAEDDIAKHQEENKENINLLPEQEKPEPQKTQDDQDEKPAKPAVPAPASLNDDTPAAPEPQTEAQEEETLPATVFKIEPPAEVDVSGFEGRSSSNTPDLSAGTKFSTGHEETILETIQPKTPQTVSEDETRAEDADSAIPVPNETKDDLVPPSAVLEVPLDRELTETSATAPEPQDASSLHQSDIPSLKSEPLEARSVDAGPAKAPEFTHPNTPPANAPPSPEIEPSVAPFSVSIDPVPADEGVPEEPPVEIANLVPLDQRRKIHLEPIQVPTPEYSDDDNLLSDDSFMEELRSATVQEARPVSVKSPGDQPWGGSRAVSSSHSLASSSPMQAFAVGRSVSSSYPDNGPPTPLLVAKKVNVSSGISSRIKALEKFQSREGTPQSGTHPVGGPSASSSFDSLRKRASVSYGSPESFCRAPSLSRPESRSSPNARRTSSISVTARIIRDTGVSPGSNGLEPTESDILNLQPSPLTVQHGSSEEPLPTSESVESTSRSGTRSMSISSAGSSLPTASASRPGSRLSLSSRSKADENAQASSPSPEEKKASRASRLMRRMSSMTTNSRRSIIGALSPPVKEEDANPMDTPTISRSLSRSRVSEPIDIGEVNVQFPDTLLWKRRFMRIDENGYVVLTPGTTDASARNMTKRYHLSEFRTPCLPDEDMQELPNSILLDFLDGSTLQCACESRQGQLSALQTLIDAHGAHQQ